MSTKQKEILSEKEANLFKKKFGKRVREIRNQKGFSQLDLASILNIDKTSISRLENGRVNVKLTTAVKLAIALEVDLPSLYEFEK